MDAEKLGQQPAIDDAGDSDQVQQALMLQAEEDDSLSMGERAINRFYRLAWPTALSRFVVDEKLPLRLLCLPQDTISGDNARGMAIRAGFFHFLGIKQKIDGFDHLGAKLPPGFQEYYHGFHWLRDFAATAPREQLRSDAEAMVAQWLDINGNKIAGPGWQPHIAAWRFLHWAAYAPLIIGGDDRRHRARVLHQLDRTARMLDQNADKAPFGTPRLATWVAIVTASLILPGGKARRIFGEAGLKRLLKTMLDDDGGVISRSPRGQFRTVALLGILRSAYEAADEPMPKPLYDALAAAVPALQGITHFDGSLASWQGAPALSSAEVDAVVKASKIVARPLQQAPNWGYQRIPAGGAVVLVDAGAPPLAKFSESGCASTLAFEFSSGDQRIITSCGGASCIGGAIPAKLSQGLRATAAHSTLCLDNLNSTAVLAKGTLGNGVTEVELERKELDNATRLEVGHDGYARNYGLLHRRILLLRSDGTEVRGEDLLVPTEDTRKSRRRKFEQVPFAIRFHLSKGVETYLTSNARGAMLRLADGRVWQLRSADAAVTIEDSLWVDASGTPQTTKQIVLSGNTGPGGGRHGWVLKQME
ncbi:heparinase II/III family protein [Parasphingorhabdus sp. DH2-15]|uniref:heparinase II/III family protein n=1 Tax=Parasphingorhabdus sp. DH2-15 TaxID=3444112 RepID=UPI003F688AF5